MNKSYLILIVFLLQFIAGCAGHHHDRFPSSDDLVNDEFTRRNPRFRR